MLVPTLAIFVAFVVVTTGVMILWSNPQRAVNRAVFIGAMQMAIWLICWHLAATSREGLFWLRWTCSVGALAPLNFWIVKECILYQRGRTWANWLRRSAIWTLMPAIFAIIPFSRIFIPPESTAANPIYGWGYYAYIWGLLILYAVLFRDTFRSSKSISGGPRLELQVWLGGGCVLAAAIYVLMALGALTGNSLFRRLQPLATLLFYVGTAYAVTNFRIFDARQIVLVVTRKLSLVVSVAIAAFGLQTAIERILPSGGALLVTTAISLWLASILDGVLDRIFEFYPRAGAARRAAFIVAQRESRLEMLQFAFGGILKGWGQSEHALILANINDAANGKVNTVAVDEEVMDAIKQLRWATPERLIRETMSSGRKSLGRFLEERRLGVIVIIEGTSLTSLIGVGVTASRRPYTYPQVTELMELASIMESALERAHFSAKVQRTEQLATVGLVGAGLAHEIRNPLVSIKTFVQLLPTHHHDPVFREKFFTLIGEEVRRIDQLTEQLLDLAAPRHYRPERIELHAVLRASLDLVAAKAAEKQVEFFTDFRADPDGVHTDAGAAKQVMLNLCFNAIQAVEAGATGGRWIKVATRNVEGGVEMAVSDSGPGIAPEMHSKLFQPFQTTKSTGFGLGLAICRDILANLHASISADQPVPGEGATLRVIYPCQAFSS